MQFRVWSLQGCPELVMRLDAYARRELLSPMGSPAEFLVLMAVAKGRRRGIGWWGPSAQQVTCRPRGEDAGGQAHARQVFIPENRREHFLTMTPRGGPDSLPRLASPLLEASEDVFGPLGPGRGALGRL